jgi:hypothetical protein
MSERSTFPRNNDIDWGKIQKPRKVDADLLTYFKEVEHLLDNPGEEDLDQQLLLQNIYDEMKAHEASLASDKKGSQIMEKILSRSTPKQIRSFFSGFKGYFAFLATNRYSSHVLQRIMGLAGQLIQDEMSGVGADAKDSDNEEEEDESEVLGMRELISACFDELMAGVEWVWLMQDISGSHVLRSLVCILSGRKLVADKRGKKAKHKEPEKHGSGDTVYNVPDEFANMLSTVVSDLMGSSSEKLLEFSCDSNASPLLQMLLRLNKHKPAKMEPFVKQLLNWDDKTASVEAVWNLSAEQTGSHVIEAVLECGDDTFVEELYQRCLNGHLVEYAAHPVSNYVVQQLCMRSTASLVDGIAVELMDKGGIAGLLNQKRSGIVWRLLEACVRHSTKVREVAKAIFSSVQAEGKKQGAAFGGGKPLGFASTLLKLKLPASSVSSASKASADGRLWLDVPGAHIFELILSPTVCGLVGKTVCRPVLESFLSMTQEELVAMAKDNTSSRYVMEAVIGAPDTFDWAKQQLVSVLKGQFAQLGAHKFGNFIVEKLFRSSALEAGQRVTIAEELAAAETMLAGAHFGRKVLENLSIPQFKSKREQWLGSFARGEQTRAFFDELVGDSQGSSKSKSAKSEREKAQETKHLKDEKAKAKSAALRAKIVAKPGKPSAEVTLDGLPSAVNEGLKDLGVEEPADMNDLDDHHLDELRAGLKPVHQKKLDRFVAYHRGGSGNGGEPIPSSGGTTGGGEAEHVEVGGEEEGGEKRKRKRKRKRKGAVDDAQEEEATAKVAKVVKEEDSEVMVVVVEVEEEEEEEVAQKRKRKRKRKPKQEVVKKESSEEEEESSEEEEEEEEEKAVTKVEVVEKAKRKRKRKPKQASQ